MLQCLFVQDLCGIRMLARASSILAALYVIWLRPVEETLAQLAAQLSIFKAELPRTNRLGDG